VIDQLQADRAFCAPALGADQLTLSISERRAVDEQHLPPVVELV
jgi:hypothetical protein